MLHLLYTLLLDSEVPGRPPQLQGLMTVAWQLAALIPQRTVHLLQASWPAALLLQAAAEALPQALLLLRQAAPGLLRLAAAPSQSLAAACPAPLARWRLPGSCRAQRRLHCCRWAAALLWAPHHATRSARCRPGCHCAVHLLHAPTHLWHAPSTVLGFA